MVKQRKRKPKPQPPPKGVGPEPGQEDVEAFLKGLNPRHKTCPPPVVGQLIEYRAIGCLAALLERKIPHNRLDLSCRVKGNELGTSTLPLYYAAKVGFHDGLQLFMRHGAPPNRRDLWSMWGWRPIDFAMWGCYGADHSSGCGSLADRCRTLSDLLVLLAVRISEDQDRWHTVRVLGGAMGGPTDDRNNCSLEQKILCYATDGDVRKLLLTLLIFPDRALSPNFYAGTSLRSLLIAQLAFFAADRIRRDCRERKFGSCEERALTTSLLLLELFDRVGPQYLSCLTTTSNSISGAPLTSSSTIPVAKQVEDVLMKGAVGFPLDQYLPSPLERSPSLFNDTCRENETLDVVHRKLLFLTRESTNVCRSKVLDSDFSRAIEKLCYHPYLKEYWSSQKSPFQLLFMFCLPDLVERMQCSMSRFDFNSIKPTYLAELCFVYVNEGRMVEFTAALMAVRVILRLEHPLHRDDDGIRDESPPTVYDFLLYALERVLDEEISLTGKGEDDDLVKACKEKKSAIFSAIVLTNVFEQPAQYLHWYLRSKTYKERKDLKMIVEDVVSLLKDSGVVLSEHEEICVDDLECFSSKSSASETSSETNPSSSLGRRRQTSTLCVKGQELATGISKSVMSLSTTTIESTLGVNSPIGKLSTHSYHTSLPIPRYRGSNKTDSIVPKSLDAAKWSSSNRPSILRSKSWRLLTMTKRILTRL